MKLPDKKFILLGKLNLVFLLILFALFFINPVFAKVTWTQPATNLTWISDIYTLNVSVDNSNITGNANVTFYYWNESSWIEIGINDSNLNLTSGIKSFTFVWNTTNSSISPVDKTNVQLNASAYNGTKYDSNASWYVNIDNTPPIISFTSPTQSSGVSINKNWIAANVSITEANLANFTYKLYNTTSPLNTTTYTSYPNSINWTNLIDGVYYYNVTVFDLAGNSNFTETRNITIDTTPPTVSLSLSASWVYQGDSITISCSASDNVGVASSSLRVKKPSGTTVSATCNSAFTDTTQLGTYTVTYSASDAAGNSASKNTSFTVVSPGGGTPYIPPKRKSHIWSKITPGVAAIMHVDDPDIGLKQIKISVKNPANSVEITVTKLEGKPASVTHNFTGKVYKYIEIEATNLEDTNVEETKIQFPVNKSWISENGIDPSTIALNRYKNEWKKLPTQKISEDSDYIYYEAKTPGFSIFVITGEKAGVTTTTTTPATTAPTTTIATTIPTTIPAAPKISKLAWIVIGVIIICVVASLLWKNLKPSQPSKSFAKP